MLLICMDVKPLVCFTPIELPRGEAPTLAGIGEEKAVFIDQNTLEQKQNIGLISYNSAVVVEIRPLCAWCLSEQGLDMGNGSHGICTRHAVWILQQHRERNAHRHLARASA
jgi:hypothetical protein